MHKRMRDRETGGSRDIREMMGGGGEASSSGAQAEEAEGEGDFFFSRGLGGDVLSSRLVSLNPIRYHRSSGFSDCEPSLRHGIIRLSASAGTALAN